MTNALSDSKQPSWAFSTDPKATGKRLRAFRRVFGYASVRDAANAMGMERSRWSNWEIGLGLPTVTASLTVVERHPGMSLDWIYRGVLDGMPYQLVLQLQNAVAWVDANPGRVPGQNGEEREPD